VQRGNANIVIEKQKLKDRKKEIEDLMQMLMAKFDLLSKKEYHEKMAQLQEQVQELDVAIASTDPREHPIQSKEMLRPEDIIGVQPRKAMTLAELAFAKSKEEEEQEKA